MFQYISIYYRNKNQICTRNNRFITAAEEIIEV